MIGYLAFYFALSVVSLGCVYPMLRAPRFHIYPAELVADYVPLATYDHGGLV